ncbi:hypothetical protein GWO52_01315 [Corynebacterium macginleyi]|nr:hypothetical protein [Corynebacterium macginleyi]
MGKGMSIFKKSTPDETANNTYDIDPEHSGRFTKALLSSLDRAVSVQSGVISKYVENLKKRHPDATDQELQGFIDKHFISITTGTGAAAGASASVPGIGFITGAAAIGAESVVFLEAAVWYILASAYLRGDDISSPDRRRALVLVVLTGSKGSAVVDTVVGDLGTVKGARSVASLSRFSGPTLSGINGRLTKVFTKQITKRMKWAWVGKLMPMGIGAVIGTKANRKLANQVIEHARQQLSPLSHTNAGTQ